MSRLTASCAHLNGLQPTLEVELQAGHWLAMTYACHLRVGVSGGDPFIDLKQLPGKVLVKANSRLSLAITHGRVTPDEEMDDWGFDADSVEGYPGAPTADAFVISEQGVTAVDYKEDGTFTETLIPFVGDLLHFAGNYYGDFSVEHATAPAKAPCEHEFEGRADDGGCISMSRPVISVCAKCGEHEES